MPKPLRKSASKARASKSNGEDTERSGESAKAKGVASRKASASTKSIDFGEGAQTKGVTSRKTAVPAKSAANTAAVNTDLNDTPIQAANAQKPLRRKKSHASEDKTVAAVRKKSVSKSEPVDKEN